MHYLEYIFLTFQSSVNPHSPKAMTEKQLIERSVCQWHIFILSKHGDIYNLRHLVNLSSQPSGKAKSLFHR